MTRTTLLAASMLAGAAAVNAQGARLWNAYAELVSIDASSKVLTLKAMVEPPSSTGLNQFKPGEKVVLIWGVDGAKGGDAQTVVLIQTPEQMAIVEDGYITRAEFVSGDATAKTVTFKSLVPDGVLRSVSGAQPGQWVKFTAPMEQSGAVAPLMAAMITDKPAPKAPKPKPQAVVAAADDSAMRRFTPKTATAVKANGGISGSWRFVVDLGGTSLTTECELAQDGPKIGGTCTLLDQPPSGVTGAVDGSHVRFTFPSALAATNADIPYDGDVDADGGRITGKTFQSGRSSPFTATRVMR